MQDISHFTPSDKEIEEYLEKEEEKIKEKKKLEEEKEVPQRIKILSSYRKIGKLIKKMITTKESLEKTFGLVRKEYKRNKKLTIPEEIEDCIKNAELYAQRLDASSKAKTKSSEITDKQGKRSTYWNDYYKNDASVDEWYCNFNTVSKYLPFLKNSTIMVLGCGISALGGRLLFKHAQHVDEVDFAPHVIENMKKSYEKVADKITHHLLNFLSPEFGENFKEKYDLVIEKATFDTLLSDEELSEEELFQFEKNIYQSLKPGGVFMLISAMEPDVIKDIFINEPWIVEIAGSESLFDSEQKETIRFYHLKKPINF